MDQKTIQRILVFSTNYLPNIGGAELAFHEVATRIPELNFDLITSRLSDPLNPKKLLAAEEKLKNVNVYRVGSRFNFIKILVPKVFYPVAAYFKARELCKKFGPYKKIYALQASQGGGGAWLYKIFNPEINFLLNLQEGQDFKKQGFLINFFRSLIIKKADIIIAISSYLKEYAEMINAKAKLVILPNGVDIEKFGREYSYGELSVLSDELGIKPGEKVIISISRLVFKNGVDVLINALYEINKLKKENYKLLLVGDGGELANLKLQAFRLGLEGQVIFVGSVDHAELPKYLGLADVFVRPSRSEGLGVAFLEAMAAKIPIVGTKIGGIPDFLKDFSTDSERATGLFCEIENPIHLAEQISRIVEDEELRMKITKNAADLVMENYKWDKIAKNFAEIYK